MPSPGGQFFSDEFGDIEDYFISDYQLIDQYIGDTLWTWGRNQSGQLGDNTTTNRLTPVTTFAGGTNWKQSFASVVFSSAIKTDGTIWTWGSNAQGQLGVNDTRNRSTPVTTFSGGTNWRFVSAGGGQHCAGIKIDGTLWLWGRNNAGELGNNDTSGNSKYTPITTFAGGANWKYVLPGDTHTWAIKTDGTLWTWGGNANGKLGDNTAVNKYTPVTTFAGGTNWVSVGGGQNNSAAVKKDGTLWTWGLNDRGQLGINNTINRSTPVTTFAGGTNWKDICTKSQNHAIIALKVDGTLWGWGSNGEGVIGDNTTSNKLTPVTTFTGGTNWAKATSSTHTAAIKTDGTLWMWGKNSYGALGINNTTQSNVPVTTFAGGTNWKFVSCGMGYHTTAVKSGLNVDLS